MTSRRRLSLLRYLRPEWRPLTVVLVTLGVEVALDLARPWPTKLLVDNVLGDKPIPNILSGLPGPATHRGILVWVVAGTVLIFVLGMLVSIANQVASVRLSQRMEYALGGDLFRHLQKLSLLFHHRRPLGDTLARVTGDASCVPVLVTGGLLPVLQSAITVIAMFVIMFQLQATLTLYALAVVPFLVLTIRFLAGPMQQRTRRQRDLEGRLMSVVEGTLSAMPVVQAFTREPIEDARYQENADRLVAAYQRSTALGMLFKLVTGLVTAVGTAVIMYVGAIYVLDGKLTVGTVLVFISYLASLYAPLNSISYTGATIQYGLSQADRVLEVLAIEPDVEDGPDAHDVDVKGHILYEDVAFGYEPGRPVLNGVSLEARPGEVVAIVGPTGAGKTTLVNLLVRFFDPWTGRISIDGADLRDIRLRSLRTQVAMVLQDPFIFPMSVAENIAYGRPDASRAHIAAAAKAANADAFIERLPDGYDTVIGQKGATLSGGEKQRLSIARAFLRDAPILVLDEPTSALDANTEAMLLDALDRLMAGRVTFIIAHRLSTIRHADQILVVDSGRIVERGSHEELVAGRGLYAGLYERQMNIAEHGAAEEVPS
jgi:ATP-binding cassette, subfamily B, bacterial